MTDITAAVTEELSIPDFLLRNPDNSFKHPNAQVPGVSYDRPVVDGHISFDGNGHIAQDRVAAAVDEFKEREKQKTRARISKMKSRLADKAAVRAGKKWDGVNGGWK